MRITTTTTTTNTRPVISRLTNNLHSKPAPFFFSRRIMSSIHFGPFDVTTQVFMTTPHSFALVNLKPLLPGHVLVCTRAPHKRLTELSASELTDLFGAVQRVQRMLARYYFAAAAAAPPPPAQIQNDDEGHHQQAAATTPEAGSFNIAIQDGTEAGQTVPHVHVHVIPRIRGATAKDTGTEGDAIYELMAAEPGNVGGALWDRAIMERRPQPGGGFPRIEDQARSARSMDEMEAEANMYRNVLASMEEP
ncbi:HIT domain-containing protein [Poronia punctata]|nr:HIT domain-containing protein [Poronia punctata]